VLQYFDYNGSMDDLEKRTKQVEKVANATEGVKFMGRYAPHNRKFHFVFVYEAESYNHMWNAWNKLERDYNVMSHVVIELLG
jgi:uncharacterized protein with von Willebrand factor type A (vWA) domain